MTTKKNIVYILDVDRYNNDYLVQLFSNSIQFNVTAVTSNPSAKLEQKSQPSFHSSISFVSLFFFGWIQFVRFHVSVQIF